MAKRALDNKGRPTPTFLKRRGARYTEAEKIRAVTALVACGGLTVEGINNARELLNANISHETLNKWLKQYRQQVTEASQSLVVPVNLEKEVEEARNEIATKLSNILDKSLDRAEETVRDAAYRDVMVGSGIALDKLRSMSGLTPRREAQIKQIETLARQKKYNPDDLLDDFITALSRQPEFVENNSTEIKS